MQQVLTTDEPPIVVLSPQPGLPYTEPEMQEEPPVVWSAMDLYELRAGVLKEALRDLLDGRAGKTTRQERAEWVDSNEEQPFSFTVCCRSQGLDPDVLRENLRPRRKAADGRMSLAEQAAAELRAASLGEDPPPALEWLARQADQSESTNRFWL